MPKPTNKCTTPMASEYTRSLIGSSNGANHNAGAPTSCPKNVRDTTLTTSPKYPPNNTPHTSVDSPHQKNNCNDFFMPSPMRGNFKSAHPHATAMMAP